MSDALQQENNNLKQQLAQQQNATDGLVAQLDAHRETLNESLNSSMNLRTNVIYLKKQNHKLTQDLDNAKKQIEGVNQQLVDATKRIADLEAAALV